MKKAEFKYRCVRCWYVYTAFDPAGENFWLILSRSYIRRITKLCFLKIGKNIKILTFFSIRVTIEGNFECKYSRFIFRVFVLLSYLGRKSILCGWNQNHVIEHILKALLKELLPLADTNMQGFIRGKLDLPLLSWLLMFFLQCVEVLPNSRSVASDDGDSIDKDNGL